jgi:hypothetical protein
MTYNINDRIFFATYRQLTEYLHYFLGSKPNLKELKKKGIQKIRNLRIEWN